MHWKLIVFDLDGTLIDSEIDLVIAVNKTRLDYGLQELPAETVASYVGDGAPTLIRRSMGDGYSEQELEAALKRFVHHYHDHALDNTVLFPGVRGVLRHLQREGCKMAVLTNKPVRISQAILEGMSLNQMFIEVYGGNSFQTKKPDPEGLRALMKLAGCTPQETLMVGDSKVDVLTARNAGCPCCGVSFGLQPESLREVPPDYLIDTMTDLLLLVRDGSLPPDIAAPQPALTVEAREGATIDSPGA
jgi:phosphoglycolate phosphatase